MSVLFGSLLSFLQWLFAPLKAPSPALTHSLDSSTRPYPHSCDTFAPMNVGFFWQFPSFRTSVSAPLAH
ncbi:hypothetical protein B9Z32_07510 [Limnohabitans sp. MMS-10A-178]|nr:hypothetical protein B9Z32_07510 [Limnohabitans sp. MMS-10A-178]